MRPQTYHLTICDDIRTLELFYGGNENIVIRCNVPQSEESEEILFPYHILKRFMQLTEGTE